MLSLARHCPDLPVIISCPQPCATFRRWVEDQPNAKLLAEDNLAGSGWNVKPTILLRRLGEGHSEVVWIDADIIVNQDFRQRLQHLRDDTLVAT
ncbi:MAG: nucleotide-diphospho-sugar transferase, partial [Tolypothrix sp. T3-bin4]|nr:nucleotide-diphospho-sugar transferase [Tolypothrix sp. T3-bin4]